MKNPTAKSLTVILALVLAMACTHSASAQMFTKVKVSKNAPVGQVASGGVSAWALANGNPYIFMEKVSYWRTVSL